MPPGKLPSAQTSTRSIHDGDTPRAAVNRLHHELSYHIDNPEILRMELTLSEQLSATVKRRRMLILMPPRQLPRRPPARRRGQVTRKSIQKRLRRRSRTSLQ